VEGVRRHTILAGCAEKGGLRPDHEPHEPAMKCVEAIGHESFTLADAYVFEERLAALYPGNNNVRPKIRQQLQVLRDRGWLEFLGRGRYRVRASAV
jgi:hypothetical protein